MKKICAFETDVLRCEVRVDDRLDKPSYYYFEVGLGDNEHEMLKRFETLEEAERFYFFIKGLLATHNVDIYED
jgi:hypothetical protein